MVSTNINGTLARSIPTTTALNQLRKDIILQKYEPGEKLTETQISETYGLSRSPVRGILQQLEKEGMIAMLENGCKQVVGFTKRDLLNLYDFRMNIEISAVRGIFSENERKYHPLLKLLEHLENRKNSIDEIEHDIKFHRAILEMSGNRYLLSAYNSMAPTLNTLFSINIPLYREKFESEYEIRHAALIKSLVADNMEASIEKFKEHHTYALERALAAMDQIEAKMYREEE